MPLRTWASSGAASSVSRQTGAKPAASNSAFCWRSGTSSAAARRSTIARLGDDLPSSRKLRWRCEISARPASSSWEMPRCRRHQRSLDAKSSAGLMTTWHVVDGTAIADDKSSLDCCARTIRT